MTDIIKWKIQSYLILSFISIFFIIYGFVFQIRIKINTIVEEVVSLTEFFKKFK